jgi:hypothetical protein
MALLRKVHELQDKTGRRPPAPRHNHRRVVIEPAPQQPPPRVRGGRPDHVRMVEFATRSF